MAVDEGTGSGGNSDNTEEPPPPRITIEATPGQDPIITIELTEPADDSLVTRFSTYDIYEAVDYLTASDARQFADELAERYDLVTRESRFRLSGANQTRDRPPSEGTDAGTRADSIDPALAEALQVLQELTEAETDISLEVEPPAPDVLSDDPDAGPPAQESGTGRSRAETDSVPAPDEGLDATARAEAGGDPAAPYGLAPEAATAQGDGGQDADWSWSDFFGAPSFWPTAKEWENVSKGAGIFGDAMGDFVTDPEFRKRVLEDVKVPTWESVTKDAKVTDFMSGPTSKRLAFNPRFTPSPKIRVPTPAPKPKATARTSFHHRAPTLGERMVKQVARTKAYRRLADRKLDGQPVITTKSAPKKGEGAVFQRDVSGGKDIEYVGRLRRGKRTPDGKRVRKTVQIDDLRVADDGRLVLVEAKWAKPDIDFPESGHVRYGIASKVDHLKRLARFARENPNDVNRIEIWVNASKTGTGVHTVGGEIYKAILMTMSPADQKLFTIKYH